MNTLPSGWERKKIKDIAIIQVAKDLDESCYSDVKSDIYKYPVFSNTVDKYGFYGGYYNFPEYIDDCVTVVGRGVGLGKAFARVNHEGFGAIGRLLVLKPRNSSFDPVYLENYINFSLRIFNESSGIPQLPGTSLGEYFVVLPAMQEQTKIANILSTWDKAIQATERLLVNSQQQKKALMQQLLTGKKRLKGFSGEWDRKTISQICHIGRGRVISKQEIESNLGIYPVYSSQTLNQGIMGYLNSFDFSGEYVTWTTDGVNAGTVFYRNGKFNCTNVCGVLYAKASDINLRYLSYALSRVAYKYVSHTLANPKLMNGIMGTIEILFPPLSEQQKIAQILSTQDLEIDTLQQKLTCLKQEKKALMQKLLSGKVRVN